MKALLGLVIAASLSLNAFAFCGFYVAKADASLYNEASQVVLVHHEGKTALTMFSDYKGQLSEFALVIPVPSVLKREQINVGDKALIERIDAFTAPRLVEYFDPNPCDRNEYEGVLGKKSEGAAMPRRLKDAKLKSLGVTVEAQYVVGEYDILILSAKESTGLETWLRESGYKLPAGASKALEPYLKQNLKFFVAKVNLKEQAKTGFTFLRPLQFAYESPRFMLPIRLGMVNSEGPQDMLVYAISPKGRVETTNYRTVKLPTGQNIPLYVKNEFADFYRALFKNSWEKEGRKVVFQEYAWNMGWCDPCAADPLSEAELHKLGVFWLGEKVAAPPKVRNRRGGNFGGSVDAYVTRLHVRYDREHFPEDLMFQETSDTANYQGRYVLSHPYTGKMDCPEAVTYRRELKTRWTRETETLAMLTGWSIEDIRKKVGPEPASEPTPSDEAWYKNIFK